MLGKTDSVKIDELRFYISKIELVQTNKVIFSEANSYHLLDFGVDSSLTISLKIPKGLNFSSLRFQLGIDSLTNVSGAMGGHLDPTMGMYWTWQSGYINFKLEGKSNLCLARNNQFIFHVGGYALEENSLQKIELPFKKNSSTIVFDIKPFFTLVDVSKTNHIMSPGKPTVDLAEQVKTFFQVK